jgi:hypothetical protein
MITALIAGCAFSAGFICGVFWAARSDDVDWFEDNRNDPGSGLDGKDT